MRLTDKLDAPTDANLYKEWLSSPERFKLYYDQYLECELRKARARVLELECRLTRLNESGSSRTT